MMTHTEIDALFNEARKRVHVWCDEYHSHDSKCIMPKEGEHEAWVHVCRLIETVQKLDHRIRALKGLDP